MRAVVGPFGEEDAHSSCGREGAVDVEEADGVLDGALGERRNHARGGSGGGGHCEGVVLGAMWFSVCLCFFLAARSSWAVGG